MKAINDALSYCFFLQNFPEKKPDKISRVFCSEKVFRIVLSLQSRVHSPIESFFLVAYARLLPT